jgi:hypothetical protein
MSNTNRCLAGLFVALGCASAYAQQGLVAGPVDSVSRTGLSVTVLGQTVAVPSAKNSLPGLSRPGQTTQAFEVGDFVIVSGLRLPSGQLVAKAIDRTGSAFVAGVSNVYLSGSVTTFDASVGTLRVGGVDIYVTEALVSSAISIQVGTEIEVLGRQAQPRGAIWATEIRAGDVQVRSISQVLTLVRDGRGIGSATSSIQGTGIQSIQGTGVQSIQGTGVQSIQGTGVQSIQGTGVQSIQGTGVQSIQGTGVQSIQGTGVQSIQGTGVQSIQGTGVQSIQGTGVQSIQGTGVQSIQGTGVQSIQGTGVQSIQGTGVQSIQGTGVQSIQGTGVQSIQGTGVQSIQGTGVQSIQGTGVQSIQGTGIQSIQGTGVRSIQGTGIL